MIFSSYSLTFILMSLLYWLVKKFIPILRGGKAPLPPGPYGIPIFGYLPFLRKEHHRVITKLGQKYGNVFSITMGKHRGIVLNNWKAVKAAFIDQGEIFAGRPVLDVSAAISGGLFGIIMNDGPAWKAQRRFSHQRLKELGVGKSVMEAAIEAELDDCINLLETKGKIGIDVKSALFVPIMNVIWKITAGRRFAYGDKEMEHFSKTVWDLAILTGVQADILFLPKFFLKLGYKRGMIEKRTRIVKEVLALMQQEIDKHKACSEDKPDDFITAYLEELERQKNLPDKVAQGFHEVQLQHICLNFFTAGVETTASTLGWAFLYLSIWPEIQEKIHQELDTFFDSTSSPTWSDRFKLPYCTAAILESQRYSIVLPFSVSHRTQTSTNLLGFHIPKDSLIMPNLYNISFDPEIWGDPENFRPERFINEEGNVVTPEYFLPYSTGQRTCLGAPLAKMELFIFFTNIMQRFKVKLRDGSPRPSLIVSGGLTLAPPNDPLFFERRTTK